MLVLSRKVGESIVIGDNVTIKVSQVAGNRVKIAIDAPRDTRVLREEVLEQMTAQKLEQPSTPKLNKGSHPDLNVCS